MPHPFKELVECDKEVGGLKGMGILPVLRILCEGSSGHFKLTYQVMYIVVFKVRTYIAGPLDEKGDICGTSEAEVFIYIDLFIKACLVSRHSFVPFTTQYSSNYLGEGSGLRNLLIRVL